MTWENVPCKGSRQKYFIRFGLPNLTDQINRLKCNCDVYYNTSLKVTQGLVKVIIEVGEIGQLIVERLVLKLF